MLFFDWQWNQVGTKKDLCHQLSLITGIDLGILSHNESLSSVCVARKMSWASKRETTRIEDMAYCLLGLFNVNMPLLYGEESRAFRRLQEEIIKTNSDLSIFAWMAEPSLTDPMVMDPDHPLHCGVLAQSPVPFEHAGSFQTALFGGLFIDFSISNNGVKTNSIFRVDSGIHHVLPLYCRTTTGADLAVRLRQVGSDTFVRDSPYSLYAYEDTLLRQGSRDYRYVLIAQPPTNPLVSSPSLLQEYPWTPISVSSSRRHFLCIGHTMNKAASEVDLSSEVICGCFDDEDMVFFTPDGDRTDCAGVKFTARLTFSTELIRDMKIRSEFTILAFGWSTNIETVQYTVIGTYRWSTELYSLQQFLTQGANTQTQLLQKMASWGIPRVSSAVFHFPGSKQSIRVRLKPELTKRMICAECDILNTEDVIHEEESEGWEW